jgi:hypothetical protein
MSRGNNPTPNFGVGDHTEAFDIDSKYKRVAERNGEPDVDMERILELKARSERRREALAKLRNK